MYKLVILLLALILSGFVALFYHLYRCDKKNICPICMNTSDKYFCENCKGTGKFYNN